MHFGGIALFFAAALASGCAHPSAVDRAFALTRQHREDDAVRLLEEDIAKHPDDRAARKLLVRLRALTGDMPGARREVDALAKLLPADDPTPWIELGHAFELGHRFEEALAAYDTAATVAPANPAGPLEGGTRAAHWGEVEAARPRLEEAITRGARDAATYHALGVVCLHMKDVGAAEAAYREGVGVDPKDTENWLGLATIGVMRDDGALALAAYDAVLARLPRYAPAMLGRAWALLKLGRRDDAKRAIDDAEALGAPKENVTKLRAIANAPP